MSLQKLPQNAKYVYTTKMFPKRSYSFISGSSTGGLYVFPNRSEAQKDNIDGRPLGSDPMDDEIIRPFNGDSLEQRRLDIYSGNFSYLSAGGFTEPEAWTYDPSVTLPLTNDGDTVSATTSTKKETFEYTLNGTVSYYTDSRGRIHNTLPTYPDQRSNINYEPALALLLDGANPLAEDHVHRYNLDPNQPSTWPAGITVVNDSATNQPGTGVFSGYKIEFDEDGFPYQGKLISDKSELDVWPPEIKKWGTSVSGNFIVKGYSDFSMHPRNATKKDIKLSKSSHDYFEKGSIKQRTLHRNLRSKVKKDFGWNTKNHQCFKLAQFVDSKDVLKYPTVSWGDVNGTRPYEIDATSSWTMEFWIKPEGLQIDEGAIVYFPFGYGFTLQPNSQSFVNGVPQTFSLKGYLGQDCDPITPAATFETDSLLFIDTWHRIHVRYSPDFNNGKLDVFFDGILVNEYTNVSPTYNYGGLNPDLFLGSWSQEPLAENNQNNAPIGIKRCRSSIGRVSCLNKALTQREMRQSLSVEDTNISNYKFLCTFQFNPLSVSSFKLPWFNKEISGGSNGFDSLEEYYLNHSIRTTRSLSNRVQYDVNLGHISGMPAITISDHLQELVQNNNPKIIGFDDEPGNTVDVYGDMTDVTNTLLYPEFNSMTPDSHKVLYFINHWSKLKWLIAFNSMIRASDSPYESSEEWITANYSKDSIPGWIAYYGRSIGFYANESIGTFMDDEIYQILDEELEQGSSRNEYSTSNLWIDLNDDDFLPPFSTVIDIPHIYYGSQIHPKSIRFSAYITEDEQVAIEDKDGTLYLGNRDSNTKVGHVDYENGILVIYHPLLSSIGLFDWAIDFKGYKSLYTVQYDLRMDKNVGILSNNSTYQEELKASANSHDNEPGVTSVSNIYLHDNNLNVLAKVNLASPIIKRTNDSFLFRLKLDF